MRKRLAAPAPFPLSHFHWAPGVEDEAEAEAEAEVEEEAERSGRAALRWPGHPRPTVADHSGSDIKQAGHAGVSPVNGPGRGRKAQQQQAIALLDEPRDGLVARRHREADAED